MFRHSCSSEFRHEQNGFRQLRALQSMGIYKGYAAIARDEYEQFNAEAGYDAPRLVCDALFRVYPKDGAIPPHQLKIMDVAAGTGLVGKMLYDQGVRHMDALDPCSEMRNVAVERNIYSSFVQDKIGYHRTELSSDAYDAVLIAGGFLPGHCPPEALDEMIRVCKPGGYIINSMRFEYLVTVPEYHRLERHMDHLEEMKLWERVDRYVTDRYFYAQKQGITYIYRKL